MIDGDIFDLIDNDDDDDDDDGLGNAVLVVMGPLVLLVAEEKSECSVLELASFGDVFLLEVMGKGELDCRYCRMVS